MTGYHDIRVFSMEAYAPRGGKIQTLPVGWKPFSTCVINGGNYIVCRRFAQTDKGKEKTCQCSRST